MLDPGRFFYNKFKGLKDPRAWHSAIRQDPAIGAQGLEDLGAMSFPDWKWWWDRDADLIPGDFRTAYTPGFGYPERSVSAQDEAEGLFGFPKAYLPFSFGGLYGDSTEAKKAAAAEKAADEQKTEAERQKYLGKSGGTKSTATTVKAKKTGKAKAKAAPAAVEATMMPTPTVLAAVAAVVAIAVLS